MNGDLYAEAQSCAKQARRAAAFYQWVHHVLRWGIPILSTSLAGLVTLTGHEDNRPTAIVVLSIIVSILTIINSAIKPGEEYARHIDFANRFQGFVASYGQEKNLVMLEYGPLGAEESTLPPDTAAARSRALTTWRIEKNKELRAIIREYNRTPQATQPPGSAPQSPSPPQPDKP
jgi:hypothetical protein